MSHPVNDTIYDNMEDRYQELYAMYIEKGYPPYTLIRLLLYTDINHYTVFRICKCSVASR